MYTLVINTFMLIEYIIDYIFKIANILYKNTYHIIPLIWYILNKGKNGK